MPQKKDKAKRINSDAEYALVYSTDAPAQKFCKGCSRPEDECVCKPQILVDKKAINPVFNIERKGRGGKAVTLIARLPNHQTFLDDLLKYLKKSLGTGGTAYIKNGEGVIEIQGEKLEKIRELIAVYKER